MKVILYSHSSRPGGAELAAPALAEHLGAELWTRASTVADEGQRRGVTVRLLPQSFDRRPRGVRETLRAGVAVVREQLELWRLLTAAGPDVVLANNLQAILHLLPWSLFSTTPLVVYVRDLGRGGNRPAGEVAAYRFLISRLASGCVFNSDLTRSSWELDAHIPGVVTPTAVSDEFFDQPRRVRCDEVVMLGRIADWKGQHQVIHAVEAVHAQRRVRLRLVGGAVFDDEVHLPEHSFDLEVTGHVDRPWEELATAAVLVHASLTPEPFGQVVAQAAAAGVPIVCSDVGGQMEWLEDGVSCIAVDPHDVGALAGAILEVLREPLSAAKRAEVARGRAEGFREQVVYADLKRWLAETVERR